MCPLQFSVRPIPLVLYIVIGRKSVWLGNILRFVLQHLCFYVLYGRMRQWTSLLLESLQWRYEAYSLCWNCARERYDFQRCVYLKREPARNLAVLDVYMPEFEIAVECNKKYCNFQSFIIRWDIRDNSGLRSIGSPGSGVWMTSAWNRNNSSACHHCSQHCILLHHTHHWEQFEMLCWEQTVMP